MGDEQLSLVQEEVGMSYKFEKLEVWQDALAYLDEVYELAAELPRSEDFNLRSQLPRAATSIALNLAEGSTGQTDPEQARFLGLSVRSLIETVACQHIIRRRKYLPDDELLDKLYAHSSNLARRLQAFRKSLARDPRTVREEAAAYWIDDP